MAALDFRVALRTLRNDAAFTAVSVLGLGIGIAVCLLFAGFARYSWSYDTQVPDVDDVYILKHRRNLENDTDWFGNVPVALRPAALQTAGVAAASGYLNWFPLNVEVDGGLMPVASLTALPDFREMMGLEPLAGDLEAALTRPDAFAITESAARRLFGTTDVIGRTVTLRLDATDQNSCIARIAALLPDPPANTTIPYEVLHGAQLALIPDFMRPQALIGDQGWPGHVLVRLQPDADIAAVTAALEEVLLASPLVHNIPPEQRARLGGRKVIELRLAPLRDAYFDHEILPDLFTLNVPRGDPAVVAGLLAVGCVLLALAAVNYVNAATLRLMRRQREIALRKLLGAERARLARQFVAESLVVVGLATLLGLVLAALALPMFERFVDRDLGSLLSPGSLLAALALGLVLAGLTAIYPLWIALGVAPGGLLAGRSNTEPAHGKRLRRVLSVLQVALAMGLASVALAIAWQARHAMNASPGFDPAGLLVFDLPIGESARYSDRARGFLTTLAQQPAIAQVASSHSPVGRPQNPFTLGLRREGKAAEFAAHPASAAWFELHGIAPVAGRLFRASDPEDDARLIVINALAAQALGFASPEAAVGQTLEQVGPRGQVDPAQILGIAPDIRVDSLREPLRPLVYTLFSAGATITVRARGSLADAESAIHAVWPRYYPNSVLRVSPVASVYQANYSDDARLAALLALSAGIALAIAAAGSWVLTADVIRRRSREIALRKLFGAGGRDVARLVARELGTIIALATLIALPVAAVAIARYLSTYSEHAPWVYAALALAFVVALLTAAGTAARATWRVMRRLPAEALQG